jgi:FkbM family methyltransferase
MSTPPALVLALTSIPSFGLRGALYSLLSRYSRRAFAIKPKGLRHAVWLRGKTSDRMVLRSIFVERQYALPPGPVRRILDAGANVGYSAVYFAQQHPEAEIIAVEPEADNFELLKKNASPYANIHPVRGAIWTDRAGVRISNPDSASWSFQCESCGNQSGTVVPSFRVEDLMEQFGWPDIDVVKTEPSPHRWRVELSIQSQFPGFIGWRVE